MPKNRNGPKPPNELLLVIPEDAQLATRENLLSTATSDEDVENGLDLRIDIASQEIARALVETGRPLGHLHALCRSIDARSAARGHVDGAKAIAAIVSAVARDPTAFDPGKKTPQTRPSDD